MSTMEDLMQSALTATEDLKVAALKVLRGEVESEPAPATGPLLFGMGEAAAFIGVSRPTLWRMIKAGRLEKVELFPGSFRIRRKDVERVINGKVKVES